jgi:hypothetical protein
VRPSSSPIPHPPLSSSDSARQVRARNGHRPSQHRASLLSLSLGFRNRPQREPKKAIMIDGLRWRFAGLESGVCPTPAMPVDGLVSRVPVARTSGVLARADSEGAADGPSMELRMTSNGSLSTTWSGPTGCSSSELVSGAARGGGERCGARGDFGGDRHRNLRQRLRQCAERAVGGPVWSAVLASSICIWHS